LKRSKELLIRQLDRNLAPFRNVLGILPDRGWIYTIRNTLGMTMAQLGRKVGVTKQNISLIEKRESEGAITINSLRELGNAMDMALVYGFVSHHESIENMIEKRAIEIAKQIVNRTNNTMILEDQKVDYELLDNNLKSMAREIQETLPKYLWDH